MLKKKRILVLFILIIFFGIYTTTNINADCNCNPQCSAGQSETGASCGDCGSIMRRDCQSDCTWSGWSCENKVPSNFGQQCNCGPCGCGGTFLCDGISCSGPNPTPSNFGVICVNCGTIDCVGSCINQGACSVGSTRCAGPRFQSCTGSCSWANSGTDADNDGVDSQCGDSLCDNSPNVFDLTKTATETACTDSLDNDCDVSTDCNDNDCDGSIKGTVKNQNLQLVASADVTAKKDLTTIKSTTTNLQGNYTMSIHCGTYNLVVSHPDYVPQPINNIVVNPLQQIIVNFEGRYALVLGTSCEADCTLAFDNIVHASCDNRNGCTFYDSIAKSVCDNSQPGWVRDYSETHYVTCAPGPPLPKIELQASVSCESGTLVKVTRIVVYNGKPVKLIVATCG